MPIRFTGWKCIRVLVVLERAITTAVYISLPPVREPESVLTILWWVIAVFIFSSRSVNRSAVFLFCLSISFLDPSFCPPFQRNILIWRKTSAKMPWISTRSFCTGWPSCQSSSKWRRYKRAHTHTHTHAQKGMCIAKTCLRLDRPPPQILAAPHFPHLHPIMLCIVMHSTWLGCHVFSVLA